MSTLKVTNIQATGETVSRAVSGVAAAWLNLNGTGTIAIKDSTNFSSVTDIGTGNYKPIFTNSMSSANYSTTCTGNNTSSFWMPSSGVRGDGSLYKSSSDFTQATARSDGTNANVDIEDVSNAVHGDLA